VCMRRVVVPVSMCGASRSAALARCLSAQVGYCQGMGFITAMFLSYLPEEDTFFLLLSLMNFPPHSLTGLYSPGLPKVRVLEYQLEVREQRRRCSDAWQALTRSVVAASRGQGLLKSKLPKLAAHFTSIDVFTSMYSAQVRVVSCRRLLRRCRRG
jgi:hypothetical protein